MSQLKHFIVETIFIKYSSHGWGNGYVCLPKGHPCYGMDYNEIHNKYDDFIDVNGGLTFSESSEEARPYWPTQIPKGDWWIVGFDTAHSYDNILRWPKEAVEAETIRLKEQLESIKS